MSKIELSDVCIGAEESLRAVAAKLDANALGVVFVEERGILQGVITDGDLRRATFNDGADPTQDAASIMNPHPAVLPVGAGAQETFAALSKGISEGRRVFPRVDGAGLIKGISYRDDWGVIPVSTPSLSQMEASNVLKCIEENWISSSGPFVSQFESEFSQFIGLQNALAVSNGTVAITLALQALNVPRGSEVLVPSLTFAATANAVLAAGATPVLTDVDPSTWAMSPEIIKPLLSEHTSAIVPVHLYGNPCDAVGLRALADEHQLLLVEDCAEAIGTLVDGRHVGSLADAATFSFFANKTLTTGEGGMVLFRDPLALGVARQLRDHGMSPSRRYWHEVPGFNYRLTNLQAAVGVAQVQRGHDLVAKRMEVGRLYQKHLRKISEVTTMPESPFGKTSYWLTPVLLDGSAADQRDRVMEGLALSGIETRITFPPLHTMPAFEGLRHSPDMYTVEEIGRRGICLPSSPTMSEDDVVCVVEELAEQVRRLA